MKIYTRTGDAGETSLFDGTRVMKHDDRVDAYGEVDETNAWVGLARVSRLDAELDAHLVQIQRDLFALGAELADPADKIAKRVTKAALDDDDVVRLEQLIDRLETEVPPLRRFILPGGMIAGAVLHVARTVCRRAERLVVALRDDADATKASITYLTRLSDFLFVAARYANHVQGVADVRWTRG